MRIELFFSKICHTWRDTTDVLCNAVADLGMKVPVCVSRIDSDKEAQEKGFPGSPTIKVDGRDIDPMFAKMRVFKANVCRTYLYKGKVYESPPKEMIVEALKLRLEKGEAVENV